MTNEKKPEYPPEFIDALRFDTAKRYDPIEDQRIKEALGLRTNNPSTEEGK